MMNLAIHHPAKAAPKYTNELRLLGKYSNKDIKGLVLPATHK